MNKSQQLELFQYVYDELNYYQNEWKHDMTDVSIRRGSSSVRSLLVEGKLQLAWKTVGFLKSPKIMAPCFYKAIEDYKLKDIIFAQVGGAISHSIQVESNILLKGILTEEQIKEIAKKRSNLNKVFKLNEFLESPCMAIEGAIITRSATIKYVANKTIIH